MTDFDYDVMQKKRLARNQFHNAKYKRGGCHLPHEDLTPAQMKRRNGPMVTYSMNQPMSWNDFKSMPHDLQQQYLDGLHARFGVGPSDIAKYLFLRTPNNLHRSTTDMGLTIAKRDKNRDLDGFLAWLRKADEEAQVNRVEDEPGVGAGSIHGCPPLPRPADSRADRGRSAQPVQRPVRAHHAVLRRAQSAGAGHRYL